SPFAHYLSFTTVRFRQARNMKLLWFTTFCVVASAEKAAATGPICPGGHQICAPGGTCCGYRDFSDYYICCYEDFPFCCSSPEQREIQCCRSDEVCDTHAAKCIKK
ncbi:hypothetical protein PENTCL1PPCAC_23775, partial [Pristionchus entomophagus]